MILDSGATHHMTPHRAYFTNPVPSSSVVTLADGMYPYPNPWPRSALFSVRVIEERKRAIIDTLFYKLPQFFLKYRVNQVFQQELWQLAG
jgi:hypothetical protein